MKKELFLIIPVLIVSFATTAIVLGYENKSDKDELLQHYEGYMNKQHTESIEIHPEEDYLYSMYQTQDDNKIGVLEYSLNNTSSNEIANNEDIVLIPLNGEQNNYMGIKFNKSASDIKHIEITVNNEVQEYIINQEEDNSYTDTFLIPVDFDPNNISKIVTFDKKSNQVTSLDR
ncbi:hypothetical protein [Metabacillus litoralis]|uniref:hypothetical protein n=1 Tax=Metabacillus litoralis TaxID=152268 RepID=UPI001CFE1720|nr:hypothetical protein [Metabacillus litoralis]